MLYRAHSAACLVVIFCGFAYGQESPSELRCPMGTNLKHDDPFHKQLASTVQLPAPCSGTLVTFEGRAANRKALVLTAGHCIGIGSVEFGAKAPGAGEVFKNFKQDNIFTVNTPRPELRKACVGSSELVYATLTEIDVAVYELSETYQELEKRTGAVPLIVSRDSRVVPGLKLRAPSGLHENEQACTLAADVAKVKEFDWTWGPLMRLAGCTFIGGARAHH